MKIDRTRTDKATGLSFPCSCHGCRNVPARLEEIWDTNQIPNKVQGYYFSNSTRKFFRSRINSFRMLDSGTLAVCESLSGDMNHETRVHRVTVWCRYGGIVSRDLAGDTFPTGRQAAAHMRKLPKNSASVCECHGCQLDRAGR